MLPFTLLLFDFGAPLRRRRLLTWLGCALLAIAVGYAITCIARLTPLYDEPLKVNNQRTLGEALRNLGPVLREHWPPLWSALRGYLSIPGLVLGTVGVIAGVRRQRSATAILGVWTVAVLVSALLLPLVEYPRYFATAMVPLSGFVALGGITVWDALARGAWGSPRLRLAVAAAAAVVALLPATLFEAKVLADPVHASYPGLDQVQYVTATSAQTWLEPFAERIQRGGGPYPVHIALGSAYPWGLDLRLNGQAVGDARRFDVFGYGRPAQRAEARYAISDGARSEIPPPGFKLILRIARTDGGAVTRLYERVR